MKRMAYLLAALVPLLAGAGMADAARTQAPKALFPVHGVLADAHADLVRPSISGHYLVYSKRTSDTFSVVQADAGEPDVVLRTLAPTHLNEALRFGVALRDGGIGYVSNRMGPMSAWLRQAHGDGHIAIANMSLYRGGLVPMNLNASPDGRIWCYDTSLEKVLQNRAINQFADTAKHPELLAQTWRFYDSNSFEHKLGYKPTETGIKNRFEPPSLFIFDRKTSRLILIPNAVDGALSPDGTRIAFVRATGGNYDLWMQDVNGSDLVQLTSNRFGDFEPAWSPDGKHIAFVSNRHSKGEVLGTSIYVLNIENGRITRLTNAPRATDGAPTWRDAHTIVFHSNRDVQQPQSKTASRWSLWQVSFQGDE